MGLFHKTLKDVKHEVEEGELRKALEVLQKHYDEHISESYNGQLYRLHKYIGDYKQNIYELIQLIRQRNVDLPFRTKWEETEKNLKRIKREIKKMLHLERIKLE